MPKILFVGDCLYSDLWTLFETSNTLYTSHGPFDALVCCHVIIDSSSMSSVEVTAPHLLYPHYFVGLANKCTVQNENSHLNLLPNYGVLHIQDLTLLYYLNHCMHSEDELQTIEKVSKTELTDKDHGNTCETKIDEAVIAMFKSFKGKVDVLLTKNWPSNILNSLNENQYPIGCPSICTLSSLQLKSDDQAAKLNQLVEPRYHFAAGTGLFYQRPPFLSKNNGFVQRFIGLGQFGRKGPAVKAMHALNIDHLASLSDDVLKSLPSDSTENPLDTESITKKTISNISEVENDTQSDMVRISNLPYSVDEKSLEKALSTFGDIKFLRMGRNANRSYNGTATVAFKEVSSAQALVAVSEKFECKGRKLYFRMYKPRTSNANESQSFNSTPAVIDTQPHHDCWFCLSNPYVEKRLVLSIQNTCYLALSKGCLTADHILIVPIKHYPNYIYCTQEAQNEMNRVIISLRTFYEKQDKDIIVFERFVPMLSSKAMHMQMSVIGLDRRFGLHALEAFHEHGKKTGIILTKLTKNQKWPPSTYTSDQINALSSAAYFYLELPGDNTAKGKQVDRFTYVPSQSAQYDVSNPEASSRIRAFDPRLLNFGREVISDLLGTPEKADWKNCMQLVSQKDEETIALQLRQKLLIHFEQNQIDI